MSVEGAHRGRADVAQKRRTARPAETRPAALMLVSDGTVLLENPWAERSIDDTVLRELLRTYRCRLGYCWHRGGGSREDLAAAVERELQRLEWRLLVAPEEENNGVTAS